MEPVRGPSYIILSLAYQIVANSEVEVQGACILSVQRTPTSRTRVVTYILPDFLPLKNRRNRYLLMLANVIAFAG